MTVVKEVEEGLLSKLISQDVKLDKARQGGSRAQFILVTLHMLEVDGDTSKGALDLMDGLDKVCMCRVTWCKLLHLLSLMKGF